jgi:hypothetical protein
VLVLTAYVIPSTSAQEGSFQSYQCRKFTVMKFFELPTNLSACVLSTWLMSTSVAKLDSCCCSRSLRPVFVDLLRSPAVVQYECDSTRCTNTENWLEWYTQRKLKASHIIVSGGVRIPSSTLAAFLAAICGRHVTAFTITNSTRDVQALFGMLMITCTSLRSFGAANCRRLAGVDGMFRSSWQTLERISLGNTHQRIFHHLKGLSLPRVRTLFISGMYYSDSFVSGLLKRCGSLTEVRLREVFLSAKAVRVLKAYSLQLTWLTLWNTFFDIDVQKRIALAGCCRLLQTAELAFDSETPHAQNDGIVEAFVRAAPHLTAIALDGTLTHASLHSVAMHCGSRLRHLHIGRFYCPYDEGLATLTVTCTELTTLGFRPCSCATENPAVFLRFIAAQKDLRGLDLETSRIDGEYLNVIAASCPLLEELLLYQASGYTAAGVQRIMDSCSQLRRVSLHPGAAAVNEAVVAAWRHRRPRLEITFESAKLIYWTYCER